MPDLLFKKYYLNVYFETFLVSSLGPINTGDIEFLQLSKNCAVLVVKILSNSEHLVFPRSHKHFRKQTFTWCK